MRFVLEAGEGQESAHRSAMRRFLGICHDAGVRRLVDGIVAFVDVEPARIGPHDSSSGFPGSRSWRFPPEMKQSAISARIAKTPLHFRRIRSDRCAIPRRNSRSAARDRCIARTSISRPPAENTRCESRDRNPQTRPSDIVRTPAAWTTESALRRNARSAHRSWPRARAAPAPRRADCGSNRRNIPRRLPAAACRPAVEHAQ